MTSLYLPAPVRSKQHSSTDSVPSTTELSTNTSSSHSVAVVGTSQPKQTFHPRVAPTYEERCQAAAEFSRFTPEQRKTAKKLFVPRSLADFDDGGAVSST